MKKLIIVALVLAVILSAAGCRQNTTKPTITTTTTNTTTTATTTKTTTSTTTKPPTTTTTTVPASPVPPTSTRATFDIQIDKEGINLTQMVVAAGASITITLHNEHAGITHNIAIYTTAAATQSIFVGNSTVGPSTTKYQFTAPAKGVYYFRDDFHPNLNGTFVSQ